MPGSITVLVGTLGVLAGRGVEVGADAGTMVVSGADGVGIVLVAGAALTTWIVIAAGSLVVPRTLTA